MSALTCSNGCKYFKTKDTEMPCIECLAVPSIMDGRGKVAKFVHYEPEGIVEQKDVIKFSFTKGISKKVNECHTE